jgi:peptidoglycan/LPS O-acetylase OafA/YrhL
MVLDLHYGFFRKLIEPYLVAFLGPMAYLNDGAIAVFGFFILSGYLVADMLERRYPLRGGGDLVHFLLGRMARIYPLYWLILAAWLLLRPEPLPTPGALLANVLLFPYGLWAFFMDQKQTGPLFSYLALVPAWTMALDLVFYPIGAILVAGRRWLLLSLGIGLVLLLLAAWQSPSGVGISAYDAWHFRFWTTGGPNLFAFLLGLAMRLWGQSLPRPSWAGVLALLVLFYAAYLPWGLGYYDATFLSLAALVWLVHHLAAAGRGQREALLGNFTFALYLVHVPVILLLWEYWGRGWPVRVLAVFLSGVLALSLAMGVEGPLEHLRHKWLRAPFHAGLGRVRWERWALGLSALWACSAFAYLTFGC